MKENGNIIFRLVVFLQIRITAGMPTNSKKRLVNVETAWPAGVVQSSFDTTDQPKTLYFVRNVRF